MEPNIRGFPEYHISREGILYKRGIVKKVFKHNNGYLRVRLIHSNGKTYNRTIHRLVALAWVNNPNPHLYNTVCHLDNNKTNNLYHNLKWGNQQENVSQAIRDNLMNVKGKNNPMYGRHISRKGIKLKRLTKLEKEEIKHYYRDKGFKYTELSRMYSVSTKNIKRAINN